MKSDDIFEEAYSNIKKDRKRLEELADEIKEQGEQDKLKTAVYSRRIVDIMEGLSKTNDQFIELIKIKKDEPKIDKNLDEDEAEAAWNEIEGKNEKCLI